MEKTRSMFEVATCSLEAWLSVKILITEFQAFDPAIPALDGVNPKFSHIVTATGNSWSHIRLWALCPSLRREVWNNQCVQRHWSCCS